MGQPVAVLAGRAVELAGDMHQLVLQLAAARLEGGQHGGVGSGPIAPDAHGGQAVDLERRTRERCVDGRCLHRCHEVGDDLAGQRLHLAEVPAGDRHTLPAGAQCVRRCVGVERADHAARCGLLDPRDRQILAEHRPAIVRSGGIGADLDHQWRLLERLADPVQLGRRSFAGQHGDAELVANRSLAAGAGHVQGRPGIALAVCEPGAGDPLHGSSEGERHRTVGAGSVRPDAPPEGHPRRIGSAERHEPVHRELLDPIDLTLAHQHRRKTWIDLPRQEVVVDVGPLDQIERHRRQRGVGGDAGVELGVHAEAAPVGVEVDGDLDHRPGVEADGQGCANVDAVAEVAALDADDRIDVRPALDDRVRDGLARPQHGADLARVRVAVVGPDDEPGELATVDPEPAAVDLGAEVVVRPGESLDDLVAALDRDALGDRPHSDAAGRRPHDSIVDALRHLGTERRGGDRICARPESSHDRRQRRLDLVGGRVEDPAVRALHALVDLVDAHAADAVVHPVAEQLAAGLLEPAVRGVAAARRSHRRQWLGAAEDRLLGVVVQDLQVRAGRQAAGEGRAEPTRQQLAGDGRSVGAALGDRLHVPAGRRGQDLDVGRQATGRLVVAGRVFRFGVEVVAVEQRDRMPAVVGFELAGLGDEPVDRDVGGARDAVQVAITAEQVDGEHARTIGADPVERRVHRRHAPPDVRGVDADHRQHLRHL